MVLNWPHIHLMLNHIPVLATVFGLAVLVAGRYFKKDDFVRVALWTFAVAGVFSVVAYLTGDEAADTVANMAGVSNQIIDKHEDFAVAAMSVCCLLGAASVAGLYLDRTSGRPHETLILLVLVISLVVSGLMAWTANLGGQVHHPELRPGFNATQQAGDAGGHIHGSRD